MTDLFIYLSNPYLYVYLTTAHEIVEILLRPIGEPLRKKDLLLIQNRSEIMYMRMTTLLFDERGLLV